MESKDNILLQKLFEQGKISESDLANIKDVQAKGQNVENFLVKNKLIDAEELVRVKSEILDIKYENLYGKKVKGEDLNLISLEVAENYGIIAFESTNDILKVGILDGDNLKAREAVDFIAKDANLKPEFYLISDASFRFVIKQYQDLKREISSALEEKGKEEGKEKKAGLEFEEVFRSAPIAKIVSVIMRHAVEGRASDIHIEPFQNETRVRYRIDGILHTSLTLPKSVHEALVARIKVLANLKLDETRIPQDGRIRENFGGKEIDFRISILPLMDSEKVVMRILDVTRGAPTLVELGFMGRNLKVIENSMNNSDGIILVTGPTGSGKSTTLFSVLDKLNEEGVNISTLEDPVEYFVKGANQSQVRPEVGFTFASGLRSLLRQDPDIIMVGEIRDPETAELAVHAGLTGHLVLSTLHTNDAIGAIPRLVDMKVEIFLLISTLRVVVAQRLVRKVCEYCKKEEKIFPETLASVKEIIAGIPEKTKKELLSKINLENPIFYKGAGCPRCGNTGYSGRVAIAEVLEVNDEIKNIIVEKNGVISEEEVKKNQDFAIIKEDGIIKALLGLTTIEEVLRVIQQ